MNLVVKMEFGSTVYGTSLPTSDTDFKQVYIPDAKDILLGTVKDVISTTTKSNKLEKNTSDDIDVESFSLKKYLYLLTDSQTVPTDMLFVPKKHIIESSETWETIVNNKDKFINKQCKAFIQYSKSQANRYGVRGSRMSAVRKFLELIIDLPNDARIIDVIDINIVSFLTSTQYCNFIETPSSAMIEVCNSKCPVTNKVKQMKEQYQKLFNEYGNRSREAERNEGVDFKSLGHALRICQQGLELLSTGNITFPRPNAEYLIKVRTGEVHYKDLAPLIEDGLDQLEAAMLVSTLRDTADKEFVDDLIMNTYREVI